MVVFLLVCIGLLVLALTTFILEIRSAPLQQPFFEAFHKRFDAFATAHLCDEDGKVQALVQACFVSCTVESPLITTPSERKRINALVHDLFKTTELHGKPLPRTARFSFRAVYTVHRCSLQASAHQRLLARAQLAARASKAVGSSHPPMSLATPSYL